MKKLTAGIFASLLAVVATGAAHAEIASKGYVDDINTALTSAIDAKADTATVTALGTRVGTAEGEIDALQTTTGQHTSQISTINSTLAGKVDDADIADMQVKSNLVKTAGWDAGKTDDTKYPSAAAVNNAITAATENIASNETVRQIQTDLDAAELEIDSLQTDVSGLETSKQDANLGAEAANHIVTTDSTGKITSSATIEATKVDGLSTVATTGAYGDLTGTPTLGALASKDTVATADIANDAVTTAKIGDAQVTAAKIAAGVIPSVSTQLTTGNAAAAQAGAVADALAGKADSSDLANYVTTTTANSTYQTQANLVKTEDYDANPTTASDTQYPSEKAVATAISEISTNVEGLGDLAHKDTIDSATLLGTGVVTTDKLAADAVTNAKLADDAVQAANIATGAVGADAIAASAVTTAKIADGNVTKAKLDSSVQTTLDSVANKANTADVYTKTQADSTFIPAPDPECTNMGAKCVLVVGEDGYAWEVIARGAAE